MDRIRGSEHVLLVFLLMFSWETGKCLVRGTDGDDFLDVLDQQVKEIAKKAVENAAIACELVKSCKEAGSCSRGQCAPVSGERRDCVLFDKNPFCGDGCNRIRVTFDKGYVRTPYDDDVNNSVCVQRMLDGTFQDVQLANKQRSSTFIQYYLGSADGAFRYFPGREIFNCSETYDPRIRPWYKGAIAVAKDLVLLVDNGNSMGRPPYGVTLTPAFTYARNVAQELLNSAVTNTDRVTITTFNSTHTTNLIQVDVTMVDSSIQPARDALNGAQIYGALTAASNLTGGLESALSTLNETQGTDKLKIVVLFTDGASTPKQAELAPLLAKLQEQNITLFTYIIGRSDSLQNFTCLGAQRAHFEALEVLSLNHPLRGLRSYLSFLARSRQRVNNDRAFWQSVYQSATGLGLVLTVAYPAIYNGQLVGVAGIDVQNSGLDPQLQNSIANSLLNASRQVNLTNPEGADLVCLNDQPPSCNATAANSICSSNDASVTHTDLICCNNCGASSPSPGSSSKTRNVVIISVVAGVTVLATLVTGVIFWPKLKRWYKGSIKQTPPPPRADSATSTPTSTPTPLLF